MPSSRSPETQRSIRNLADTEKRADLTQVALNNRVLERELVSGLALSVEGEDSDTNSRFEHFKEIYCNEYDNGNGLDYLCKDGNKDSVRKNRDIDYTTTLEAPLTLKIDFLEGGSPTQDERNVMALVNYLFQHNPFPDIGETYMTMKSFTKPYQDMRSVIAMRGVARNSIASFIAQKTEGPEPEDGESNAAPYIYALLTEFGWDKEEIEKMFGEKPSYYAQMEIMTQKIDPHETDDKGVTARLRKNPFPCVYQDYSHVRRGRACGHVPCILLVPRRVGHDKLAVVCREKAVGHVDSNALFAFGGQTVKEQGEIKVLSLRAHFSGIAFECGKLVFENHF